MTRYYFHAADGSQFRDNDGEELPNLEAAKKAALNMLVEMLPSHSAEFWEHKSFSVTVKDDKGRMVAVLSTTAILDPAPQPDVPPDA